MRDSTHMQSVERWAKFVRENPDSWKKQHTEFINAQFQKHREVIERLKKQPNGREKIIELYGIKNVDGYAQVLG